MSFSLPADHVLSHAIYLNFDTPINSVINKTFYSAKILVFINFRYF